MTPDPQVGKQLRTGRAAVADTSGSANSDRTRPHPNVTHPGHRPAGTNETKRKIEAAEESLNEGVKPSRWWVWVFRV